MLFNLFISNKLEQIQIERKILGFRNIQETLEKYFYLENCNKILILLCKSIAGILVKVGK